MSQANTYSTPFAPARGWCRTDATGGSHLRAPAPSNRESNKDISLYTNTGSLTEGEVETETSRRSKVRQHGRFLKGPIPMRLLSAAAKLGGPSLALYVAVHHQTALTGKPMVTLPTRLLNEMGISRDAKARGLRKLEGAGLN